MGKDKERLYFAVKSWFMAQLSGWIFLGCVLILGSINFIQSFILGAITFFSSLVILRFCDKQINSIVRKILDFLDRHNKIKRFILKHF